VARVGRGCGRTGRTVPRARDQTGRTCGRNDGESQHDATGLSATELRVTRSPHRARESRAARAKAHARIAPGA
jgi:hypothetical protein